MPSPRTATATASLNELPARARPGTGRTRGESVAAAANLGGPGLGPLLARGAGPSAQLSRSTADSPSCLPAASYPATAK